VKQMEYVGPQKRLQGRTALVRPCPTRPNDVYAQFDDRELALAYGWHAFLATEFEDIEGAA
jgi:hypothetical protein